MMYRLNIKPVEIVGKCPADLTLESEFEIAGMNLENPSVSSMCFLALSHLPMSVWQLQSGARIFAHASCPGCITSLENENRVVFLLGHADKWRLSQLISTYLRTSKRDGETDEAEGYKDEAIKLQNQGNFNGATEKMELAVRALRER
jgi:hypothetical protein